MIDAEHSSCALQAFVQPIIGLPAWGVRQGYGGFLTFDFGEPKLEVSESYHDGRLSRSAYVYGQWHLWIFCCHWRAVQHGMQLAWSEDGDAVIRRAAATLNGQKLLKASVLPHAGRSIFTFDLGGSLETWPCSDDLKDEQWMILSETETFIYRADGTSARVASTSPAASESC